MTLNEIASKLKKLKNVVIFSHNRPDGDTIGCATALKLALEKLGTNVVLCCNALVPEKFFYIKGANEYKNSKDIRGEFDAFIAVDCSCESMFDTAYSLFRTHKNTFNIDHHISNTHYAKNNYVEDTGACCEIIYKLITILGVEICSDIANSLLLGLVTDTGNFGHSNATSNTLYCASKLMEKGANLCFTVKKMFKDQSRERAALYTRVISNMQYYLDGQVAVIVTNKKDLEDCNAVDNMTEGFIDFPLTVRTVEVAISLLEVGNLQYKISFRSKGKVNVNEIASLYGGGGHVLASGAMLKGYKEDIIDKLVYNVKQRL
ncbi:MAG: bifunctional oligoribonuclease/PAP phosphatase NrnA [Clostridia bacterium]|nr:bifunctional oligoribonuclease/PAP phosphatase NrnA [Clostridia bacterium]